jgi:hypothetical protein
VELLKGVSLGWALALPANTILSWNNWPVKNTLAYYENLQITAVNFYNIGPRGNVTVFSALIMNFRTKLEYLLE